MTTALLVSNLLLWVVVVVLALVVVGLTRQIGVLYERIAPAGALMVSKGPRVGEPAPVLTVELLGGGTQTLGGANADGLSRLVFFLSPTCPVCKELLPAIRSIARREAAWLRVLLASDGERAEHERFVAAERLGEFGYALAPALGIAYHVAKLPYAVLLDEAGILRAKGLVNTREHLESLFEASERGVASLQEFVARDGGTMEATS